MGKKKEEVYTLTPKAYFDAHFDNGSAVMDKLLVFMATTGYNALIWNIKTRKWEWGEVQYVEGKQKEKKKK